MSTLWNSLISAGAGLLGAVLGVIGSLLASRRASQTAFEQVRYAVRYERKAQVMATAYDKVGITRDKLAFLITVPDERDLDLFGRSSEAYLESSADAEAYLARNTVWNDPEVDQALRQVLGLCKGHWSRFYRVWTGGPSSVDIEESRKNLKQGITGELGITGERSYNSVNVQLERIGHMMQRQLELEKPQRGQ
jgi:hypothetical protein